MNVNVKKLEMVNSTISSYPTQLDVVVSIFAEDNDNDNTVVRQLFPKNTPLQTVLEQPQSTDIMQTCSLKCRMQLQTQEQHLFL